MGQYSSLLGPDPTLYQIPEYKYGAKYRINSALAVWKNRKAPFEELIECRMAINEENRLREIYDIFMFRYQHRYLVSTHYLGFIQEGIKGCGELYKGSIYFEQPIANLSQIKDIPFKDSLHMYTVSFHGFDLLYKKYGYFDIFEDMFHFNEHGQMKVWCNSSVHRLEPETYLLDSSGLEQDIINRIIHIIHENSDSSASIIRDKISMHHFKTFSDINSIWRQICRQNRWHPPQKLSCIESLSKEDIERLLATQNNQMNLKNSVNSQSANHNFKNRSIADQRDATIRVPKRTYRQTNQIETQKYIPLQPQNKQQQAINKIKEPHHYLIQSPIRQLKSGSEIGYNLGRINQPSFNPNTNQPITKQQLISPNAINQRVNIPLLPHHQRYIPQPPNQNLFTRNNIRPGTTTSPTYRQGIPPESNRIISTRTINHPVHGTIRTTSPNKLLKPYTLERLNPISHCSKNRTQIILHSRQNSGQKQYSRKPMDQKTYQKDSSLVNLDNKMINTLNLQQKQHHHNQSSENEKGKQQKLQYLIELDTYSNYQSTSKRGYHQIQPINSTQYTDPKIYKYLELQEPSNFNSTVENLKSDTIYSFQNKQSIESGSGGNYGRSEDMSLKLNESKYRPTLDSEIWADILHLRQEKQKLKLGF